MALLVVYLAKALPSETVQDILKVSVPEGALMASSGAGSRTSVFHLHCWSYRQPVSIRYHIGLNGRRYRVRLHLENIRKSFHSKPEASVINYRLTG